MKPLVVISEFLGSRRTEWPGLELQCLPDLGRDPAALRHALKGAAGLVVRNQTRVDADLLSSCPDLRVVGRLGAGLDNIDLEAAGQAGVAVVYAPEANTRAVVEYCLAQCINLLRRIPEAARAAAEGIWDRTGLPGRELGESVIGVIGYGPIGRGVAGVLGSLGATVMVHTRPRVPIEPPAMEADLETLLVKADLVTVHIPGGPENSAFLGAAELARMKKGALLLNTSRGSVVDEEALFQALKSGRLAAAALDVRQMEPPGRDRLSRLPNLYQTPHLAGLTRASQERTAETVLGDLASVLEGRRPRFPALVPGQEP